MTAHCFNPTATVKQSRYFPQKLRLEGMFAPKKPTFCWLPHALKLMEHSKFRSRPSYRLEITLIEPAQGNAQKTVLKRCEQTVLLTSSKELH